MVVLAGGAVSYERGTPVDRPASGLKLTCQARFRSGLNSLSEAGPISFSCLRLVLLYRVDLRPTVNYRPEPALTLDGRKGGVSHTSPFEDDGATRPWDAFPTSREQHVPPRPTRSPTGVPRS